MAQPDKRRFGDFKIKLGDGATPEVFAQPCGFTSKALKWSKETVDTEIPDCTDENLPIWLSRDVKSFSMEVSGEGVLAPDALAIWDEWFAATASRNIKVEITLPSPAGVIAYTGKAHLTEFEITGELGDAVKISVTIVSDGAMVRSPALT